MKATKENPDHRRLAMTSMIQIGIVVAPSNLPSRGIALRPVESESNLLRAKIAKKDHELAKSSAWIQSCRWVPRVTRTIPRRRASSLIPSNRIPHLSTIMETPSITAYQRARVTRLRRYWMDIRRKISICLFKLSL